MKKLTYLFCAVLLVIFAMGAGRSRYGPDYWVHDTGGIKYIGGNVDITAGTFTVSGIVKLGTDTYAVTKTVIKTIDLDDDTSTDDFQFDDDAGDSTAQNKDLGTLIPAWAEVVSCQLRCFESVGSGTFQVKLGTSSGGTQLLAQATVDNNNELAVTAAAGSPVLAAIGTAQNVWMEGDPNGNWSAAGSAGRWVMILTYRDHGAVFTAKNP